MALVGRRHEMAEVERLLDRAAGGQGGVLAVTGPPGSGRTELADAAAREGTRRGFEVLRTAAMRGQPGVLVWAQLLRDAGAPDDLASRLLHGAGPLDLDTAARVLATGSRVIGLQIVRAGLQDSFTNIGCIMSSSCQPAGHPSAWLLAVPVSLRGSVTGRCRSG